MIADILTALRKWAHTLTAEIGSDGIYVFGSLVYRDGAQFVDESDVDLVVRFPRTAKTAMDRLRWLEGLYSRKVDLESTLAEMLKRDKDKPICSFVVPTEIEISADLHKDGSPTFFTSNQFLNLLTETITTGISGAGTRSPLNPLGQMCLRFTQKERNIYLDVTASRATNFSVFDGQDPLPKDIMRHAAMAAELSIPGAEVGSQFDIQFGLDFVSNSLYEARNSGVYLSDLHNRISIRRNARGTRSPLTQQDLVFLAEWISDQALASIIEKENTTANALPKLKTHSTVFFAQRFDAAFPDVVTIKWFHKHADIKERLEILLDQPLKFEDARPIWWWRGGNNSITKFRSLNDGTFLLDHDELSIQRIAAVSSMSYFRNFVYVEVKPMRPTGLYDFANGSADTKGLLSRAIATLFKGWRNRRAIKKIAERNGYCQEEYGLVDNKHKITRGEFDAGAAKIKGRLQNVGGRSELRIRYLTPYNFLVSAQMSPINNSSFDLQLIEMLNGILNGSVKLEVLSKQIDKLPKHEF